ncbi:hypothetical protein LI328DRAFT_157723 [Trichoderma asperelloides]|nr:hypothetical protein LI328DRAFT_157723 [Trichoderma asperelloides]
MLPQARPRHVLAVPRICIVYHVSEQLRSRRFVSYVRGTSNNKPAPQKKRACSPRTRLYAQVPARHMGCGHRASTATCHPRGSSQQYDAATARYLARGALRVPAVPLCHPPPKTSQRQSCNTTAGLSTKRRATSFNLPPRPSITTAARVASLMSLGLCRGIWPLLHPWIACSAARPLAARRCVSPS